MLNRHDEKFLADAKHAADAFLEDGSDRSPLDARVAVACREIADLPLAEECSDSSVTTVANAVYDVSRLFVEQGEASHDKDMLFTFTRCVNLYLIAHGGKRARVEFGKWRDLLRKFCESPEVRRVACVDPLVKSAMTFEESLRVNPISSDDMIADVHREMVTKQEFRTTTDELKKMIHAVKGDTEHIIAQGGNGKDGKKSRHRYAVPVKVAAAAMGISTRELERILAKEIQPPDGFPGLDSRARFELWVVGFRKSKDGMLWAKKEAEKRKWGSGKPRPEKPDRA